jgi:hypothetical protein
MKKDTPYANFFAVNSERIKQRDASVHEAVKDRQSREGYKKWRSACDEFRAQYDSLAFPGGYTSGLDRLKSMTRKLSTLRWRSLNFVRISSVHNTSVQSCFGL